MSDTWPPATYLQFEHERTPAAHDRLAQVPLAAANTVVDLGCGPRNSTALLLAAFHVLLHFPRLFLVAAR
jgi:trans-aconitate 2-methyltransferase